MDTLGDFMNLNNIIDVLFEYKIKPEYQYVSGSVEFENKTFYQSLPYQPETTIYLIWKVVNPDMSDEMTETQSQQYLKDNPNIRAYLKTYLLMAIEGGGKW